MNITAHQEKEKNEKTGKREAGEERKQSTDFKKAACCLSAVVQGEAWRKIYLCEESDGVTRTLGKTNSHFDPTQTGSATAPLG